VEEVIALPQVEIAPRPAGTWTIAWRRLRRNRVALACGVVALVIVFCITAGASIASRLLGHGPDTPFPYAVSATLQPAPMWSWVPNTSYLTSEKPPPGTGKTFLLLGADGQLGRDEFLRILYGGRVSLAVGVLATLLAILIGTVLGAIAGWAGGLVDAVISRFTDLVMAFPYLLFIVMVGSIAGSGLADFTLGGVLNRGVLQLVVLIGAFTWFYPARIVRTQVQSLRHAEFVEAAVVMGARDSQILRKHLLPYLIPPLLAYGTIAVATNVMVEIGVTFLGAGARLPTSSWGSLLAQTYGSLLSPNTQAAQVWLTLFPSIAIFLTVFCINQFGEGLSEALDSKAIA
jgi:peptide/nickel transport system permease protein